jgi:hypothetical protein
MVSKSAWKIEAKRPENPAAEEVPVRVEDPPEREPTDMLLVTEKVDEVALPKDALLAVRPVEEAVTAPPATLSEVEALREPTVEEPTSELESVAVPVAVRVPAVSDPIVLFAAVRVPVAVRVPNTPKPPVIPLVVAPAENVWRAVQMLEPESEIELPPRQVPFTEKQPLRRLIPLANVEEAVVEVAVM